VEVNGRRVNEAIERGSGAGDTAVFTCECGHVGCNATVRMTIAEYEAIRSDFDRFFLVPGHEIDGVDAVDERHDGYFVVRKQGEAREVARDADLRTEHTD